MLSIFKAKTHISSLKTMDDLDGAVDGERDDQVSPSVDYTS